MQQGYKVTQLQGITDLTLTAPVKGGFVPGAFDTELHVERLRRLLTVLGAVREAAREAALQPSPFPDSVGRFQGIHFFRFAIVEPDAGSDEPHRLFLNVTFDGGWEPYMRIIWGPLGTLLDLIFCNCDGYPLAWETSYRDYIDWVRANEKPSPLFYADSAASVADAAYRARLDALLRERGDRAGIDATAAAVALPAQAPPALPSGDAVQSAIRVLKALAGLRPLFPPGPGGTGGDNGILLRFAHEVLSELRQWIQQGLFDPGQPFDRLRAAFDAERIWLMSPRDPAPPRRDRLRFDEQAVQAGITAPFDLLPNGAVHGALVLLRVDDAQTARDWLARCRVTNGGERGVAVARTLALTCPGLRRLGVHPQRLERLPREFIDGMEARAGTLGDLRGNHPQAWRRPRRNWRGGAVAAAFGPSIELSSVHVLVQLRTADAAPTDGALLPGLVPHVAALEGAATGMTVLAVQPMAQQPPRAGERFGSGHFGYADGFSQPTLSAPAMPPSYWSDQVKTGELFLGHVNDHGDGPDEVPDVLLDNGSFLVVRKLRQHADRLERAVATTVAALAPATPAAAAMLTEEVRARLMGRYSDGRPRVAVTGADPNDFSFRQDAGGAECPVASHIRRANPREPRPRQMPPRLARRGMSYGVRPGPGTPASDPDYGLVFMAYNASISEQFEVIQRWLAGGNSSGGSSADDDPFVGVPEPGRARVFRYVEGGRVVRVDLGAQPLVELQWGVYAFVPSLAALAALPTLVGPPTPRAAPPVPVDAPDDAERWKRRLEDARSREAAWAEVRRAPGGVLETAYGWLVGSEAGVRQALQDRGGHVSVAGYGQRMSASIGLGYLGEDDHQSGVGHRAPYVAMVNDAIERSVSEAQAFDTARDITRKLLDQMLLGAPAGPDGLCRVPLAIDVLAVRAIAQLCTAWFGLPDEVHVTTGVRSDAANAPPSCPGHLLAVSRYVFSPDPSTTVENVAKAQGQSYNGAVGKFLAHPANYRNAAVTSAIMAVVPPALQATTVAGIMLGFPPTTLGNLVSIVMAANQSRALWDWQQRLIELNPEAGHAAIAAELRGPMLAMMRRGPVPYMNWRRAGPGCVIAGRQIPEGETIVVGLGSAVSEPNADAMLMFGGDRHPPAAGAPDHRTVHACPGYGMAVGVMLGVIATLLNAGELRPTSDPRSFTLLAPPPPPRSPPAGAAPAPGANPSAAP